MFSVGLEPWNASLFTQEDTGLRLAICQRLLSKRGKEGPEPKGNGKGQPIKISTPRPWQISGQHEMNTRSGALN